MKTQHFFSLLAAMCLLLACNHAQPADQSSSAAASQPYILTPKGDTIQKVVKTEEEWAKQLTKEEFYVLRQAGTERAGTGEYVDNHERGEYLCRACKLPLFSSETKFESGTGWPSFWQPLNGYCIEDLTDNTHGMARTEVRCARCSGHLGHVFDDGPKPTGLRYCMNSVSLAFVKK